MQPMADLKVRYMGLDLRNPLVAASSGLTKDADAVRRLADAGVGAVVLKSIFEEQISHEVEGMRGPGSSVPEHPEAWEYIRAYGTAWSEENYLNRVREAAAAVDIPVIASVNCVSAGSWVDFARKAAEAGAAGIELNVFVPPMDPGLDGRTVEARYHEIARAVKAAVKVPVAMKVGMHFSGMANFLVGMSHEVDALVLFNRYYRMNIDIESMKLVPAKVYSEGREYEISMRWISVINEVAACDLAASTGIHSAETAVKMILVGARSVQLCSSLYEGGVEVVPRMLTGISNWMERHGYSGIEDFRGVMSRRHSENPAQFDRVQFMKFSVGLE